MRTKFLGRGLVAAVLSLFVLAGVVEAKSGKKGNGDKSGKSNDKVKIELEAELEPPNGSPEPGVEGDSERKIKTKNGASKENRFKAEVEIPIPNALLIDESNAAAADIRLLLSRAGVGYAECQLVFDEIENDDGELEAEYKLDLKIKKGKLKSKGSCDVGLPDVAAGDLATAVLVANPLDRTQDVILLQGAYEEDD
jgi:hypothetical protein